MTGEAKKGEANVTFACLRDNGDGWAGHTCQLDESDATTSHRLGGTRADYSDQPR